MANLVCVDCGQKKPHHAKGLCNACYTRHYDEAHREKRAAYRQEHREGMMAKNARYYREHREDLLANQHRYNEGHREDRAEYNRCYDGAHREDKAEYNHRYYQANPEKYAVNNALRRTRKADQPNTLTPKENERLFAIGQGTWKGENVELDHFISVDKGGGTTLANSHYIPASLNRFKYNKLPQEVYKQLTLAEGV